MPLGDPFIELTTVDSTNNYAMAQVQIGTGHHGTAYFAHEQTAGKGQRGKTWTTMPGENLILSLILKPRQLSTGDSFLLSATIANACYDFFTKYAGDEIKIKWPNDLYWRDRKTGGILIENVIRNEYINLSIVGIGLNINQTTFGNLIHPVSLKQITGKSFNPVELAKELCFFLDDHYNRLEAYCKEKQFGAKNEKPGATILEYYSGNLYKRNSRVRLRKGNVVFETTMKGVSDRGNLITEDVMVREFTFGEVEWIL